MVSRALYNFQAQNYRELSFKKGDLVYIRRQVIWFFDREYVKLIMFLWPKLLCFKFQKRQSGVYPSVSSLWKFKDGGS